MIERQLLSLAVAVALTVSSAAAQGVNTGRLEELRGELSSTAERVRGNLAATVASISSLNETNLNENQQQTITVLESMEAESREILQQVKLNSPFMDELDRARAEVLVILRKQEREPASPRRDNRVTRLESALAQVEQEYERLQAVESQITRSLSQHAQLRREIVLEGEVENVEGFVDNLSELAANLERMVAVLDEVGSSILEVSDAAPLSQD